MNHKSGKSRRSCIKTLFPRYRDTKTPYPRSSACICGSNSVVAVTVRHSSFVPFVSSKTLSSIEGLVVNSVLAVVSARLLVNEFAKSPQNEAKPHTSLDRGALELAEEVQAQLRKERKRVTPSPKSAETCKPDIGGNDA